MLKPLSKQDKKPETMVQAKVDDELNAAVEAELERLGTTKKEAVNWGLKSFLIHHNPKVAQKLGLIE